jgi:very-short-patch-repair endonuclease
MAGYIRYRRMLSSRAPAMRKEGTRPERKLWYEFLRARPEKFTRQKPLGEYIADFYCSRHRLVIELDGDTHFVETARRYDLARTQLLNDMGIRVLRFTNREVTEAFEGVFMEIERALETS